MNEKTKYQILRQREIMKGYTAADVNAEPTDEQQKLAFPLPLKPGKGTKTIPLPMDFDTVIQKQNIFRLLAERHACENEFSLYAAAAGRRSE